MLVIFVTIAQIPVFSQVTLISKTGNKYYNIQAIGIKNSYFEFNYNESDANYSRIPINKIDTVFSSVYDEKIQSLLDSVNFLVRKNKEHIANNSSKDSIKAEYEMLILKKYYQKINAMDANSLSKFKEGNFDAQRHYKNNSSLPLIFLESALLGSPVALVTSIICSYVEPNDTQLFTSDYNKFKDQNYLLGYKNAAMKMKRNAVWQGFTLGLVTNIATVLVILIL